MENSDSDLDCAICLQKCHHPTKLPCGHVFCFLCVKGVAIQSQKCAMCRAEIPADYLDHPVLLSNYTSTEQTDEVTTGFQWYYEGRNGWWKYDERSNTELEVAYSAGETNCSLLVAGAVYIVDFPNMLQVKRSDPTRRRHVRRDTPLLPAKGIAGIKKANRTVGQPKNVMHTTPLSSPQTADDVIEILDDDDEHTAESPSRIHELDEVLRRISVIDLEEIHNNALEET